MAINDGHVSGAMERLSNFSGTDSRIVTVYKNLQKSFRWARLDIVCRYRRSSIGPWWETINILVMILGITMVSSAILGGGGMRGHMPYIGLGIMIWSSISTIINEGTAVFTKHASQIRTTSIPIDIYAGRTIFGILITFGHHAVLYFVGIVFLPIDVTWTALLALPGLLLLYLNAFWIVPTVGFICARFRDMALIIRNLVQLAFFMTPIFWNPDNIDVDRKFIVDWNILFYFIQIVRDPLLGKIPPASTYAVVIGAAIFGYCLLYLVHRRMRRYLALYV